MKRFERRLPHRPEKVWRALTEERELTHWFPGELKGEKRITECDPPRVLAYTVGDESLRWEVSPTPEGCVLVLTTKQVEQVEQVEQVAQVAQPANDNHTASFRCAA